MKAPPMTHAPSIEEALELAIRFIESHMHYSQPGPDRGEEPGDMFTHEALPVVVGLNAALATLQPSGERREAIARIICYWDQTGTCHDNYCIGSCRAKKPNAEFFKAADEILASGLVQNEAGWRDISTAPQNERILVYNELWDETHGAVQVAMLDYAGKWVFDGELCIDDITEDDIEDDDEYPLIPDDFKPQVWKPLPAPPIRSARNGGEA